MCIHPIPVHQKHINPLQPFYSPPTYKFGWSIKMSSGIGVCLFAATIFLLVPPPVWPSCDLIVHVKSATNKQFKAQVIAPNGQKSEKWTFRQNRQRETFQQKAANCSIGQWQIQSFDQQGVEKAKENVILGRPFPAINVFL